VILSLTKFARKFALIVRSRTLEDLLSRPLNNSKRPIRTMNFRTSWLLLITLRGKVPWTFALFWKEWRYRAADADFSSSKRKISECRAISKKRFGKQLAKSIFFFGSTRGPVNGHIACRLALSG
jgi:hypothetical protein